MKREGNLHLCSSPAGSGRCSPLAAAPCCPVREARTTFCPTSEASPSYNYHRHALLSYSGRSVKRPLRGQSGRAGPALLAFGWRRATPPGATASTSPRQRFDFGALRDLPPCSSRQAASREPLGDGAPHQEVSRSRARWPLDPTAPVIASTTRHLWRAGGKCVPLPTTGEGGR